MWDNVAYHNKDELNVNHVKNALNRDSEHLIAHTIQEGGSPC